MCIGGAGAVWLRKIVCNRLTVEQLDGSGRAVLELLLPGLWCKARVATPTKHDCEQTHMF